MSKSKFFTGQPIFSQLLSLIPDQLVNSLARKYSSDRYSKYFRVRDHLVTMLYSGFFQCSSIRELITGIQAQSNRLLHLGLTRTPRRSTLSDANKRRDSAFFEELFHRVSKQFFSPDSRRRLTNEEQRIFLIDSTTISLFSEVMKGAGDYNAAGRKKGGVKAHMMVDASHDIPSFVSITEAKENDLVFLKKLVVPPHSIVVFDKAYINYSQFAQWDEACVHWVTRLKEKSVYDVIEERPVSEDQLQAGIRSDRYVKLGRPSNQSKTPIVKARLIEYFDEEKNRSFLFITNKVNCTPLEIAGFYKQRWQIELLFKRIKQRYPLKYFLGESPNAIKIQIWCALICDLLVKIIQQKVHAISRKRWSYATLSGMIKHHLMTYINLIHFLLNPEKALQQYHPPNPQLRLSL